MVEKDYELNRYRSSVDIELRHRLHILPYFGKMKAVQINESDIDNYVLERRQENASNATINRELCTIKRAFNLGIQKRIVSDRPHILVSGKQGTSTITLHEALCSLHEKSEKIKTTTDFS